MNAYEQMKNNFYVELEQMLPDLPRDYYQLIGAALDHAAFQFDVTVKETSLTTTIDYIPPLLKTYIAVKKVEGLADGTLTNYAHILKNFFLWVRKRPEDVVANDVRMFLYEYSQSRKVSDRTLDKYREFICWFFHWAYTEEYIKKNPCSSIKAIKHEVRPRQSLTQIELEYLRAACDGPRDKAILEFLYSTGCRVSELSIVTKDDVNWKDGTVHIFGKGRKHRNSFMNAKCEVCLREYLNTRNDDSEYLFVSSREPHNKLSKCAIESIIKKIASRANLSKTVSPHIIRHTTATQALNNGMSIEEVSKLLGHSNVTTTMTYAKVSEENVRTQHIKHVI